MRNLEAEKAKMEVFRRELPISVHLVADVIEWLKEELAQHRRLAPSPAPAPELFAPAPTSPAPAAKRKAAAPEGGAVKAEADANDKRSWMSSAQLWSCGGGHDGSSSSTATNNGAAAAAKPAHKVSDAFMPLSGLPTLARSPDDAAEKPTAVPVPEPGHVGNRRGQLRRRRGGGRQVRELQLRDAAAARDQGGLVLKIFDLIHGTAAV